MPTMRAGRTRVRIQTRLPAWPALTFALLIATSASLGCAAPVADSTPSSTPVTDAPAALVVDSTVSLSLDGRQTVADVYSPGRPSSTAVVFVHGFMRDRSTFADHARAVAAEGVLAVVPDMPYLTDSRRNARALADLIAQMRGGQLGPPVERVVLVGFSAGGLAALLAADTPGVVGYLGLDPFDRPGGVGLDAARTLDKPARLLRAPSGACNAFAISAPWSSALRRMEGDRVIDQASHCDFESPTDGLCELVCGRADAQRQQIVRRAILQAVRDWLQPAAAIAHAEPVTPLL